MIDVQSSLLPGQLLQESVRVPMLTAFALFRIPLILGLFAVALWFWRKRVSPSAAIWHLLLPLTGLLFTSAGDFVMAEGKIVSGCVFFGMAHLSWFAFLIQRGRFAWKWAGILIFLLIPFLTVLIFPAMTGEKEIAIMIYALCSTLSCASAIGSRKIPAGKLYLAGISALVISDIFLALRMADILSAHILVMIFYIPSILLITAALIRSVPHCVPLCKRKEPENTFAIQRSNATLLVWVGCMPPLFFLCAMLTYQGHYCWYNDFISESGLVFVKHHRPNHLAAWFLTSGLTLSGLLCTWFFRECFRRERAPLWQRWIILLAGVAGSAGLAGIGAAPFDQHPDLHNFFTLSYIPLAIAILLVSLTPDDRFGSRAEKTVWLIFILFISAIVWALNWLIGQKPVGLPRLPTGPVIQKIMVLAFYTCMLGHVITYRRRTLQSLDGETGEK